MPPAAALIAATISFVRIRRRFGTFSQRSYLHWQRKIRHSTSKDSSWSFTRINYKRHYFDFVKFSVWFACSIINTITVSHIYISVAASPPTRNMSSNLSNSVFSFQWRLSRLQHWPQCTFSAWALVHRGKSCKPNLTKKFINGAICHQKLHVSSRKIAHWNKTFISGFGRIFPDPGVLCSVVLLCCCVCSGVFYVLTWEI